MKSTMPRTSRAHVCLAVVATVAAGSAVFGGDLAPPSEEFSHVLKGLKAPPSSERQWRSPDLRDFAHELTAQKKPEADAHKDYELAELIDLAERINPETKVASHQPTRSASPIGLPHTH